MERTTLMRQTLFASCMVFFICCIACGTTHGGLYVGDSAPPPCTNVCTNPYPNPGPPAHAQAHGYRAKHTYRYYPEASVYFDIGRDLYFYQEGSQWQMSARLPARLRLRLGDNVTISMDSDKPYQNYAMHKQKYPPGKNKKKHRWDD